MKKILLLFVALFCLTATSFGQAPPFSSAWGGTGANGFPLNTTTSNKVQWIYGPGEFSSMGGGTGTAAYQGLIDTLWYRVTTPTANMTAGFEISLGQNVGTQTSWANATFITGLTSVQGPGALNFATLPTRTSSAPNNGTWVGFPLATPYLYDPALSLVIEVRQNGYSTGTTTPQLSTNGTRRIWGGYAATTGSSGTGQANMGMSLSSPLNCATPTMGSASFIGQDSVTLSWTENNVPATTTWQIEWGPSGFSPTGTPQITTTTNPHGIGGLTQNTSYDFYVRAYCGPGDSSYYHPILNVTTLATCPWPTALTATNITSSSADLAWTENGTATTWDIEIGISGFTPTGTPVIPGVTTNPYSLVGLPGNTCFDYYVRAACGGTNGNSVWTGPFTFCTSIPPLACPGTSNASVIYTENFDNAFTGQTNIPNAAAAGWTNTATGNPRWALESNGTSSGSTGPTAGAPNGANNGYAYLEVSCVSGGSDTLTSPAIDLTAITGAAEVKWFNHMYGPNSGKLEVFVDNGSTLTSIYVDSGQTHTGSDVTLDPWDSVVVSLNAYVGQTINLRFVGTAANPGGCSGDRGLDDIEVQGCVSCAIPTALAVSNATATTADLSWTPGGSETVWDVHVQAAGAPAPTLTTVPTDPGVTTNNPYGLTGLTPFQLNDVYVRADCGADSSAWAGPIQVLACAPLAGTYTIDPSIPTSGTNFNTLNQVAIALDCGISAPVIFDMAAGTSFNEQVIFDEVIGASKTNTITFNGNGDTVFFAATVSAERHTIRLDAADFFNFNDLVVQSTGASFGFAMHLYNASNGGTDCNTFTNCTFSVPLTSTSSAFCPMPWSGSLTSPTTAQTAGNGADSNIVDSCNIIGGFYGLTMYGPFSAPYAVGNQVLNTNIEDFYFYGYYHLYQDDLIFSKNDISRPTRPVLSTFYGVYGSGLGNRNLYEKNHIHTNRGSNPSSSGTMYGFYFFIDASSAANENIIENNLIEDIQGGGTQYGIYSSTAQNLNVRHNTVVLDDQLGAGGITRGIVQFGTTAVGQKIQNNNIVLNRASTNTHYGLYVQSSTITESNNNVYINPAMGGTNYYGFNGGNQVDLTAWQASTPAVGVGNTDVDPIFVNPAADDYEPGNSAMDDLGAALGVLDDHIDAPRSATTPDMGAFEFTVSCPQPDTLVASNVTVNSADLTWVEMGSATQWEVEWVVQGNPPTGMGTVTTTQPVSATGLISGTAYDWYVRAICGPADSSNWASGVFVTPTGCDSVTNVLLSGVTANTVTVAWTDTNSPAAGLWNVEIVLQGSTPTGNGVLTTSNPYTDTTLLSNTCYDVYIQTACDTSTSSFSFVNGPHTFCTPCATVTAAQFCMDGNFTSGVPACWTNTGGDAQNWRTGTPGYAMNPTLDHTNGTTSNNGFLWVDGSGGITNSVLTSVPIDNADVAAMTNPMLQFFVKSHSTQAGAADNATTDYNEFWGRISYDGGVTFVDKVFINSELGIDWNLFQVEVDKTLLGTNDLIFQFEIAESATSTAAFYNDIALDDVCLIDSTCAGQFTAISTVNGNSDCECTDLAGWTHYGDQTSQELNLSVQKGAYNDPNISPFIVNVQGAATGASGNLGTIGASAPYVTAQHWYVMNRFWDVDVDVNDALRQPSAATDVRFYYFDADYTALQTTVATAAFGPLITAHTDMLGWKVANDKDPNPANNHATVLAADFTAYTNGAVSPTTWAYTPDPKGALSNQLEYQVATFSGGGGGFGSGTTNGPLPVSIIDFTVTKEGSISLAAWATANEENNSHFNLQRSLAGNDFATLGKVNSKAVNGTSTVELGYTFTDESPQIGHNYYRLEQVDLDGQKSYSEVVDLVWGADGSIVAIYPNPATDKLNVDISIDKVAQIEVRLLDMSGRVIKSVVQQSAKGMNNVSINLSDIATGVYGVQILENNNLIHSSKVNKRDR